MHNSTENKSIVFDMDSTLTDAVTIDELATAAGVVSKVEEITKRAICGELDVCQALTKRVRLFKGLSPETAFDAVNHTCYMPGAALILSTKSKGCRAATNSCGFILSAETVVGVDFKTHPKERYGRGNKQKRP